MDPMAFFRKRAPRRIIGRYRAPAPSPRPPLATLVDEARMVAHAAVRMAVKNRIIVLAAGERRDFDPVLLRAFTRETLEQLAQQQRAAAEYERAGQHAIRRGPVLAGLAAALEADAVDREFLERIVEEARDAAWSELASSLTSRLADDVAARRQGPDYHVGRDERIAAFVALDLLDLAYDRGVTLE